LEDLDGRLREKNDQLLAAETRIHELQKEQSLEEYEAKSTHLHENSLAQLQELRNQLAQNQELLKNRESALEAATTEAVSLRERLFQLESSNQDERTAGIREAKRMRDEFEAELSALQAELQQKDWAIAQRQASMENLAQAHKERTQKLEARLAEQQLLVESRQTELDKATSEARTLFERIAQLETATQHAEATALARLEQMRQDYETRLRSLQDDLEQKTSALEQYVALDQREEAPRDEVRRLQTERPEKPLLLDRRNEELLHIQSELDQLRERFTEIETFAQRAEIDAANEGERMQSNKEEYFLEETHMSDAQKERFDRIQNLVETMISGDEQSFPAPSSRRWRLGFESKRRWRS
jgi:chromosome segregation ATPase